MPLKGWIRCFELNFFHFCLHSSPTLSSPPPSLVYLPLVASSTSLSSSFPSSYTCWPSPFIVSFPLFYVFPVSLPPHSDNWPDLCVSFHQFDWRVLVNLHGDIHHHPSPALCVWVCLGHSLSFRLWHGPVSSLWALWNLRFQRFLLISSLWSLSLYISPSLLSISDIFCRCKIFF